MAVGERRKHGGVEFLDVEGVRERPLDDVVVRLELLGAVWILPG
jgi:hypothetical protein